MESIAVTSGTWPICHQRAERCASDCSRGASHVRCRIAAGGSSQIVRRTGHSRNLVRQISCGGGTDMFRTRQSTLDGHLPFLDAQWSGGCRNGAELWRRLKGQGFKGSLRVVAEWATRRRSFRDYQPSTIAEGPRRQDDSAADGDEARPPDQGRDRHACRHRTKRSYAG